MLPAPSASFPPSEPGERRQPRVALCEPDDLLRALLGEWLHKAGFEPVLLASGASATDVALVIADVPAPRLGGAAHIGLLRRRFPQAGLLAISAQFMPGLHGTTAAAIELGADAVLAKPFGAQVFIDAVRALVKPRLP